MNEAAIETAEPPEVDLKQPELYILHLRFLWVVLATYWLKRVAGKRR